jgi:hypothetical protein
MHFQPKTLLVVGCTNKIFKPFQPCITFRATSDGPYCRIDQNGTVSKYNISIVLVIKNNLGLETKMRRESPFVVSTS